MAWRGSRAIGRGRFAIVGLGAVVAAVLANVLVYRTGQATVGYDARFSILADVGTPIFFTDIPVVGATLPHAALPRFARRPARVVAIIAAIVFVVATIPDFPPSPASPARRPGGRPPR